MSTCTGSGYLNSTASCLVGVKAFIFLKALYFCLFISGCAVSLLLCGLFCRVSRGPSLAAVLLTAVASLVAEHGF